MCKLCRGCIVAVAFVTLTVTTHAQPRPDTRRMTCGEVNAFVQQRGAVVMTTGRFTYQRFVAHRGFCDRWLTVKPEYAPTRDAPRCPVNYVCWDPPWNFGRLD